MPSRLARQVRLSLEELESRETPTVPPWPVESFDTTPLGSRPTGWSAWASDGSTGPVVAGARALAGASLASTGGSATTGLAWSDESVPSDVRASAAIFVDALVPARVVVRGSRLGGPRASYYAASVARGTE